MSWLASILVALGAAALGLVLGGFIASHAVSWYRISSFEGGAGYFVVSLALLGFVIGLVIGIVASRVVAGSMYPSVWRAIVWSQLLVVDVAVVVGAIARFSADVPPRLHGEPLLLAVEIRWPATQTTSPATDTTPRRLRLYASHNHVARTSRDGALWMEDAHLDDGRWVVPGAVAVFTSRGDRVLAVEPAPAGMKGFLVPLPAWPKAAQLEWSEWLPRALDGAELPDGFRMRFKVLPRSQPVRTQHFGPWEIATVADDFYDYDTGDGTHPLAVAARFLIRYRGTPVVIEGTSDEPDEGRAMRFDRAESVALLPGAPDALLVRAATSEAAGPVYLLVGDGARVRSEHVAPGLPLHDAAPLTNDVAEFRRAREWHAVPGIVDRTSFARTGEYLFHGAVLTTQPASVRRFPQASEPTIDPNVPPLGVSPDGRRFVRLGWAEDERTRALVVTDVDSGATALVPIDVLGTRLGAVSALDPAWLAHYYAWTRDAEGRSALTPRVGVAPLPWQGMLTAPDNGYREYHVQPAGEQMFDALTAFLRTEMGATRTPEDESASAYQVHIGGQLVHVIHDEHEHEVGVYMDRGVDARLVATIAQRFDAALATGKYDALFTME